MANIERHIHNITQNYGLPCVVSINRFTADTDAEHALLRERLSKLGVQVVLAEHWAKGGEGAEGVARAVVAAVDAGNSNFKFVYEDSDTLWDKMKKIATKIYGAADISADAKVRGQIKTLQEGGYGHFPVCVAKTQSSFSTDPSLRGAPSGHMVNVREVRLAAGAEFIVMICGDIMTMPGLPKEPASIKIDIDENGNVINLS
jgi:formate--tetrahydrofolate ligase